MCGFSSASGSGSLRVIPVVCLAPVLLAKAPIRDPLPCLGKPHAGSCGQGTFFLDRRELESSL